MKSALIDCLLGGLLACLLVLPGCSVIREHPRTSAVVAGVVVTSVALTVRGHHRPVVFEDVRVPVAPCATHPAGCQ